jgi:phosphoribosylanthranilate isomerase
MSLIVKICGLSTPDTLDVAIEERADMVGFVFFPPSPRHLAFDAARALGKRVRGRAQKVALTVDADDALLDAVVESLQPDMLQLHGKEPLARVSGLKQRFGLPVMKAIPVETRGDLSVVAGYAAVADRLLFDARAPREATRPGGKISIRASHSCCPAGSTPAMSVTPYASPVLPVSMSLPAWSARPERKTLIRFALSCTRHATLRRAFQPSQ